MAAGRVACTGSSMFLKRRYGVGYTLTVVKAPTGAHAHSISDLVRGHVPDAVVQTNVGNGGKLMCTRSSPNALYFTAPVFAEITFRLPLGASGVFPTMLGLLEQRSAELGVANFGISVTTMEDVFLKVAHGEHQSDPPAATPALTPGPAASDSAPHGSAVVAMNPHHTAAEGSQAAAFKTSEFSRVGDGPGADGVSATLEAMRLASRPKQGGMAMHWAHFRALFIKRLSYARRDFKAVCYQLLVPVISECSASAFSASRRDNITAHPSQWSLLASLSSRRAFRPTTPRWF